MIDEINFVGNFDTGWYDPFHHELGISLEGMTIMQPYYAPASEEAEEEEPETNHEDTGSADTGGSEEERTHDEGAHYNEDLSGLYRDEPMKENSGSCSSVSAAPSWLMVILAALGLRRHED